MTDKLIIFLNIFNLIRLKVWNFKVLPVGAKIFPKIRKFHLSGIYLYFEKKVSWFFSWAGEKRERGGKEENESTLEFLLFIQLSMVDSFEQFREILIHPIFKFL